MNLQWFLGFLEGEGCFTISFNYNARLPYAQPHFLLSQGDELVLEKCQEFLKGYGIKSRTRRGALDVSGLDNCRALCNLLSPLVWQTSKRLAFIQWSECIDFICDGKHCSIRGTVKLRKMSCSINNRSDLPMKEFVGRFLPFIRECRAKGISLDAPVVIRRPNLKGAVPRKELLSRLPQPQNLNSGNSNI